MRVARNAGISAGAPATRPSTATTPTDPVTFVAVTSLLVVIAAMAGYLPARRASRIDPMAVLTSYGGRQRRQMLDVAGMLPDGRVLAVIMSAFVLGVLLYNPRLFLKKT